MIACEIGDIIKFKNPSTKEIFTGVVRKTHNSGIILDVYVPEIHYHKMDTCRVNFVDVIKILTM